METAKVHELHFVNRTGVSLKCSIQVLLTAFLSLSPALLHSSSPKSLYTD